MTTILHKSGLTRLPLRAAAFVVLVCVAILGMSGVREWSSREASLKDADVDLANLARSLMQHADDSLDLLDASIVGVVGRLDTDGTSEAVLANLRTILVARKAGLKRINYLAIIGENGDWLASSGEMWGNLSDREYFQHHRDSADRALFIGRPVRSKANKEWITTLSRRFNHADGSFAGVVFATVSAAYFGEFYDQFDIGEKGTLSLLRNDGIMQARRPDDGSNIGRDVSGGPFMKGIGSSALSGVYYFKSALDGEYRLGAYQRSSRYPFIVLATKAQDEVLAPWRRATIVRMLFVFGLVLLIAAIGLFLVRELQRGQRMAAALAAKEANFRVLAEGSSDMVTRVGLDERIHYASPSSIRVVGWPPEKLTGTLALAGVHPEDLPEVERTVAALRAGDLEEARVSYRTRHREKSEIWVESTLRVTRVGGEIDGVVVITRDMTEQKDLAEKLETLATEDALTGLANRRRFDERLLEEWGRACREKTCLSLLMIDVDHFKTFNDRYGHPAGDWCLRSIAAELTAEAKRATDLAARYGGEEFVMLLPNTDAAGCERIGERIRRALAQRGIPHAGNLPTGHVTVSLGGATILPAAERLVQPASLVGAADKALYAAKHGGRDRLVMSGQVVPLLSLASATR